jgi:hypothetical protein
MAHRELTEHTLGLTWVGAEAMQRSAHALAHEGRVWLIDPFDDDEAIERAQALGEVQSVLQLFVAHERDGAAIAKRLNVPFEALPEVVRDSPFSVLDVGDKRLWKERALWWPEPRGLVVAESIGTAPHYAVGRGPAGVHFLRRLLPPSQLRSFLPEHLLVGHGAPIHGGEAAAALLDALNNSRRDLAAFARKAPGLMRNMRRGS